MTIAAARPAVRWYSDVTREQWHALAAAKFGWMFNAMDFALYVMALGRIKVYFGLDDAAAGLVGTITLLAAACGGVVFGVVADHIGRRRTLNVTMLIFSVASLGAATSQSFAQLVMWRAILGLGMGGEWASGAVLVSETWPAQHRTKAICIVQSGFAPGYVLAAALAALFLDVLDLGPEAWRWLFAAGAVPVLFVRWVARHVREPALWIAQRRMRQRQASRIAEIFGPSLRRRTMLLILLTSSIQFAYWGLFFWLPQFLARPVDQGGAGMTLVGTMWWIVVTQIGAYAGYLSFGVLAERLGRTRTFVLFMIAAAVVVPVYSSMAASRLLLMALSPLLGYVGHGYFSAFGSMIAELYPTPVRGTGQGLTYNAGRLMGALAPYVVGTLTALFGIGGALWVTSAFFLMSALLIVALPDRSGLELED